MARAGNGTSAYLEGPTLGTGLTRVSFHFWYRNASASNTGAVNIPFNIGNHGGDTYAFGFNYNHTVTGKRQAVFIRKADTTIVDAQLTTNLLGNTWYAIGGSFDGSNLKAWLNGANQASVACSDPSGSPNPFPQILAFDANPYEPFDAGTIAEVAVWSGALSGDDFYVLGKGFSPAFVRPSTRLFYADLVSTLVNRHGAILSDTSTTVADHPPQIWPAHKTSIPGTATLLYRGTVADTITDTPTQHFVGESANSADTVKVKVKQRAYTPYLATGRHRESVRGD